MSTDQTPEPSATQRTGASALQGWLDNPRAIERAAYALCAVLLLADPFVHKYSKFAVEHVFGFYALLGLAVGGALVLVAWALRPILTRSEEYYNDR